MEGFVKGDRSAFILRSSPSPNHDPKFSVDSRQGAYARLGEKVFNQLISEALCPGDERQS
jgi:hypothetical protein